MKLRIRSIALALLLGAGCGETPRGGVEEAPGHGHGAAEGRIALSEEAIRAGGIGVAAAGPARVRETLPLRGRLVPNEDTLSHVMPRFPGVVREVHKRLGDPVARGDVLAVIEANQSLHPYEVRAALPGTVIRKQVTPGEVVSDQQTLFVIADLRNVWADLDVYREDFGALRVGQPVVVGAGSGSAPVESTITYLSPVGAASSQTLLARAVVANESGLFKPGLFVTGAVVTFDAEVPVAVPAGALQEVAGRASVFVRVPEGFEVRAVTPGRRDAATVEISSGLRAGEEVATAQSFVLKSELLKWEAEHGD